MIHVDLSGLKVHLEEDARSRAYQKAESAFEQIRDGSGPGSEWLGWREILANPNDAILEQLDSLATAIRADADVFIVCGIGGSYLGAKAVIEALSPAFRTGGGPEIIYAGHQLSGSYLQSLISYLEVPNDDGEPKSVFLNVISKSGTTLETALSFRLLRKWMNNRFPEDADRRIICTTSKEGGALNKLVDEFGYRKFVLPDDVGGRFSVLTPVGLLPIAVAGIDIRTLFYDAVSAYERLEEDPTPVLKYAAARYALYEGGTTVDVLASFEPELESLGRWLQQLLGESEGKEGKGLFPAVLTYSTDLHSMGQYIQQGPRNMMETFIKVEKRAGGPKVEKSSGDHDNLNYLAGKSMHEINNRALEGTENAHRQGGIPTVVVSMEKLNAQHLGEFIYFYQLMTAVYCYCLGVNPFDQPGVEAYKKEMYHLLGKGN